MKTKNNLYNKKTNASAFVFYVANNITCFGIKLFDFLMQTLAYLFSQRLETQIFKTSPSITNFSNILSVAL